MTVFVYSPNYVHAIEQESKNYMFNVQAYSTLEALQRGMLKSNVVDVMAYAFVGRVSKSFNQYVRLLRLAGVKKVYCLVRSAEDATAIRQCSKYCEFDIEIVSDYTDESLNKKLFGKILYKNREPYAFSSTGAKRESRKAGDQRIPDEIINILQDVRALESVESTMYFDSVYTELCTKVGEDSPFTRVRLVKIYRACGLPNLQLEREVDRLFENMRSENKGTLASWALHQVLLNDVYETSDIR